jgi:multiple sugar transport system substrate-binding protein
MGITMPRQRRKGVAVIRMEGRETLHSVREFLLAFVFFLFVGAAQASSRELVINSNASDPAPRAAWAEVVQRFQAENPQIAVRYNLYDHESYKRSLRNWLTSGSPDVVFWFVGRRMREFVEPGLLEDVSDLFTAQRMAELPPGALDLVSVNGRRYGAPYSYYHVGFFFRRDLLQDAGIAHLEDWPALIAACDKLKAQGIAPFAIGSRDLWPTAAWFDYLNLRSNGHAFHMQVMEGRVPYTDPRIRTVFARWRELIDRDCFMPNHASQGWQQAQAWLYQGKAGMMLIGNYIVPNFPADMRERMAFAPFPMLDAAVPLAEDAPMNSLHIPARAQNKEDARRFLAFVMRADIQEALNRKLLLIPVNRSAAIADDPFLQAGAALLRRAQHLSQFFDRDTSEDLATIAMKGFQEFMLHPDRLDTILQHIERARLRIYGP